jgi:hypothetical protein
MKYSKKKHIKKHKNTRKSKSKSKSKCRALFKLEDYNSSDGMVTRIWGPPLWHFLHTMSFNYPVDPTSEDKKYYRNFIFSLEYVLPCKHCRMNFKTNLKQLPLTMKDMKNRETFSKYVYELHELINRMLHKKSCLTYCQVRDRYEHFRSRCNNKPKLFKLNKHTRRKNESGCIDPLYGKKNKCIVHIVPEETTGESFQMDKKCIDI